MSTGLANRALWPIAGGLRALGYNASAILLRAGIQEAALKDPEGRLPHLQVMSFWRLAVEITGEQNLGLRLAQASSWDSFDLHTYLMSASATLGDAYRRMCRYQRLIHDETQVELAPHGDHFLLSHCLKDGAPAPRQPAEFLLAAWLRIGRHITGERWSPLEVRFAHPKPSYIAAHKQFFGPHIRFASGVNALLLTSAQLSMPCRTSDPALLAVVSRLADRELAALPDIDTWAGRVRAIVARNLELDLLAVSRELGLSGRTLQRRLNGEGTSFARLVAETQSRQARLLLAGSRFTISQIAVLLGYAGPSAFHRSFVRTHGITPTSYRASAVDSRSAPKYGRNGPHAVR